MGLSTTFCRSSSGLDAPLVRVETNIREGIPAFQMVGLPETAVRESKERVRVALRNSRFRFPKGRILINLAPADLKKRGGQYDLAIAIGLLAASKQIPADKLHEYEFAGELGLNLDIRPIYAALPFAMASIKAGRKLIISNDNRNDVALVDEGTIFLASNFLEVTAHFQSDHQLALVPRLSHEFDDAPHIDLSEVHGQQHAKKALEVAGAGGHHLLMIGPPGTGKTMLSQCLPGILPKLTKADALEVAAIRSLCKVPNDPSRWLTPPFQAPHHSASHVALVGGGSPPRPGEISRAHHGILFLDELPEFQRQALEALREPIESGSIQIARANYHERFPARFQLIAAMNPCPCGNLSSKQHDCRCTPDQILRYQNKISGPLLDRIDLHVHVPQLPKGALTKPQEHGEDSATVQKRVNIARKRQLERQTKLNRHLSGKQLQAQCFLETAEKRLLETAIDKLKLSTRSYQNILRVARTLADLAESDKVNTAHLSEAMSFRSFDQGVRS